MKGPHLQSHVTLRYRGHVTNKKKLYLHFHKAYGHQISTVVTQDKGIPLTKSRDTSVAWSRDKSKTLYLHIHKAHGPQNLVGCCLRMRGPHPQSHVILPFCSHMTIQKCHIFSTTGSMLPKLSRVPGFSVVITIEVCAEGNWLIQVSAYFHPLPKKVYIKFERSSRDATESLCSPKINTNTTTRTKNDEMNQSVINSKIHLYHYLCESRGFMIARSSQRRCSMKKVFLKISQN